MGFVWDQLLVKNQGKVRAMPPSPDNVHRPCNTRGASNCHLFVTNWFDSGSEAIWLPVCISLKSYSHRTTFDYAEVDGIITTVIRDGEFSNEFADEIAGSYPDSAGIKYSVADVFIGKANMESTPMMVAGADGNYVG